MSKMDMHSISLSPRVLPITATGSALKSHKEILKQRAHKEEKIKEQAQELAETLKDVTLSIGAKTSTKGKIFGSVNAIQIAEALAGKRICY